MSGDEALRTGQVAMLSWSAPNIFDESISLRLVAQQRHGEGGDGGDGDGGDGDDGECDGDSPPRHGKGLGLGLGAGLGLGSGSGSRSGSSSSSSSRQPHHSSHRPGPWSERVNVLASRPQHIALYEAKPSPAEVTRTRTPARA